MNLKRIPSILAGFLLLGAALTAPLASVALAHGGFEHVNGTVSKLDHDTLTVKTLKGEVEIKLTGKTEITGADHKLASDDLKPGMKVTVNVPEGDKTMTAASIKVTTGSAPAAASHDHSGAAHP